METVAMMEKKPMSAFETGSSLAHMNQQKMATKENVTTACVVRDCSPSSSAAAAADQHISGARWLLIGRVHAAAL